MARDSFFYGDDETRERMMSNPAALRAAVSGDPINAITAATPGGIERQEAAGQKRFVASEQLPEQGLSEHIKDYLRAQGFEFGELLSGQDRIFRACSFPPGWEKRPAPDHSMWSYLYDPKGRQRASIFFKAAFYDYNARISFQRRYTKTVLYLNDRGERVPYGQHTQEQTTIIDHAYQEDSPDYVVETFGSVPRTDKYDRAVAQQQDEYAEQANERLAKLFPQHADETAYWDAAITPQS